MSENHKIAESLEALVKLTNHALNHSAFLTDHADSVYKAGSAISYLVNLFLCLKCQGSGEVYEPAHHTRNGLSPIVIENDLIECPDCGGTGIKADILDRLEAEEITGKI